MFSLLYGFWNYLFSSVNINILIIGVDNAGKTTLLERIKAQFGAPHQHSIPPDRIPPTIGMNLAKIRYKGCQLVFWDLGGQSRMRRVWEAYYSEANCVVFVVDAADSGRLEDARQAFASACGNDILAHTPVLVLANKQDLPNARSPEALAEELMLATNSASAAGSSGSGTSMLAGGSSSGTASTSGGSDAHPPGSEVHFSTGLWMLRGGAPPPAIGVSALTSEGLSHAVGTIYEMAKAHATRND